MKYFIAVASLAFLMLPLTSAAWRIQESSVRQVEAPTTVVPRDNCVTSECHSNVKDYQWLHGPLEVNACDSCHLLNDAKTHAFSMVRSAQAMCLLCHEFSLPEAFVIHKPLESGDCLPCHDPHGGSTSNLLRGQDYADMCASCHEDLIGARQLLHGPASAGECGACHEPHTSRYRMLLSEQGKDLCLRCHATIALQLEKMHVVHAPARDDCRICHDPHATDHAALLTTDPVTLCTGCHAGIAHTVDTSSTQHAAVVKERACLNCHDPHASDHPSLLRKDTMTLCFECHDQPLDRDEGGKLVNIREIIEGSTSLHGPTAQRNCVACHQIHGSQYARLLRNNYAADFYLPFEDSTYSLCFTCHERQAVLQAETTTVTSFRNGSTNLHYVHVHREAKGRTCRICHDSHAASREHHIRDEVPFGPGGWMLPIGWEATEDGGKCAAACHSAFEYNRVIPVEYPDPPANNRDRRRGK